MLDNPALTHAAKKGEVVCLFVYDPSDYGGAAKWWLHHSLKSLSKELGALHIATGDSTAAVLDAVAAYEIDAVFWNRRYEPKGIAQDTALKAAIKAWAEGRKLSREPAQRTLGDQK